VVQSNREAVLILWETKAASASEGLEFESDVAHVLGGGIRVNYDSSSVSSGQLGIPSVRSVLFKGEAETRERSNEARLFVVVQVKGREQGKPSPPKVLSAFPQSFLASLDRF
jgi:hypothetical protein